VAAYVIRSLRVYVCRTALKLTELGIVQLARWRVCQ